MAEAQTGKVGATVEPSNCLRVLKWYTAIDFGKNMQLINY
jgi:hypothetical protein